MSAGSDKSKNLWDSIGKVGFRSGPDSAASGADLDKLPDGSSLAGHPYRSFLHRLERPARYTGGEIGSVTGSETDLSFLLAFPDVYEIGMSHLGFKILYSHLNQEPGVRAERVYSPWLDLEKELRTRKLPLVSLEGWRPMSDFDVVGFSLQYELTFTNVLTMLDLGGIPLRTSDRGEDDPLVMAGGPSAFQPEPMAPFFDAFLIGDGEGFFLETVKEWKRLKGMGMSRRERLVAISQLDGIYVPSLYTTRIEELTGLQVVDKPIDDRVPEKICRAHVADINDYPFPTDAPVANTEVVFDRSSIEIARGCTEGCRFCQAGMIYRPVRERDPGEIKKAVRDSLKCGGFDEVSLTSLSTADYSAIQPLVSDIMPELRDQRVALSVSSLRAYGLTDQMLDEMATVRNTSLTFAPEAGTQRMRDVVNKNISEDDIAKSAHRIFSRGWRKMKLYFMIGLPTEKDEDVVGIADTGKRMLDIALEHLSRGRAKVTVSVSSHVPKPFTPFQWAAQDSREETERKHDILRKNTREKGLELRWHDPNTSFLEGVLGRGDRVLADVIERAWRKGCRFDGWSDRLQFDTWVEALEECQIEPDRYLGTIPVDARLPWDHIDCGVEMSFLLKEYRRSLKDRTSPPCGKPFRRLTHHTTIEEALEEEKRLVCFDCGIACDMNLMKEERLGYLEKLGAHRRGGPAVAITEETLDEVRETARLRRSKTPHGKKQVPSHVDFGDRPYFSYRLRYAKFGQGRFISHLDLNRMLPRALRRGNFTPAYSQGFHPIPKLSFGPPLKLGMAGFSEMVEIRIHEEVDPSELVEALNRTLPEGILIRGAHAVGAEAPKLSRITSWGDYLAFIPHQLAEEMSSSAIERLLSREEILIERVGKKGKIRSVDIRQGIAEVRWLNSMPGDLIDLAQLPPGRSLLQLRLALEGKSVARPLEVVGELLGYSSPESVEVVRRRSLPAPEKAARV